MRFRAAILLLSLAAADSLGAASLGVRPVHPHRSTLLRACDQPRSRPPAEGDLGSFPTPFTAAAPDPSADPRTFDADEPLPLWFWAFGASPRRAILAALTSWAIAIFANLFGVTTALLSLAPEASREKGLDAYYPVAGFKRCTDDKGRYTFRYPVRYVTDQAVYMRNADAAYKARMRSMQDPMLSRAGLDPSSAPRASVDPSGAQRASSGPEVAFGPPGQSGEENLSIVVGSLLPGFSLRGTLGEPTVAAETLLNERIAKVGVREVSLIGAFERTSRSGRPLYQFEYTVAGPRGTAHFLCVAGAAGSPQAPELVTLVVRVPEERWQESQRELVESASSFELL